MEAWMKKIRTFKCNKNHVTETLADDLQLKIFCDCGRVADRIVSAARYFSNTTGKSPSC